MTRWFSYNERQREENGFITGQPRGCPSCDSEEIYCHEMISKPGCFAPDEGGLPALCDDGGLIDAEEPNTAATSPPAPVAVASEEVTCPDCSAEVEADEREYGDSVIGWCPECGTDMYSD